MRNHFSPGLWLTAVATLSACSAVGPRTTSMQQAASLSRSNVAPVCDDGHPVLIVWNPTEREYPVTETGQSGTTLVGRAGPGRSVLPVRSGYRYSLAYDSTPQHGSDGQHVRWEYACE